MPGMIDTCNEALSEIAADEIASIDEGSPASKQCKRFYQSCIDDLLALHEWGFANKRATLALKINDRLGEWGYAYAKPADAGKLERILPQYDGSTAIAYPRWGWWGCDLWDSYPTIDFIEDASTIYTHIDLAVLEYTANVIPDGQMSALFRRALVHELASRLAYPIKKDRQLKGDQIQLALAARALAIADDMNRYPRRQPEYRSEVEAARMGYC